MAEGQSCETCDRWRKLDDAAWLTEGKGYSWGDCALPLAKEGPVVVDCQDDWNLRTMSSFHCAGFIRVTPGMIEVGLVLDDKAVDELKAEWRKRKTL